MAAGIMRGVANVTRNVKKEFRGVANVTRTIVKEWRGVANVARVVYRALPYNMRTWIDNNSEVTVYDSFVGIENGTIRIYADVKGASTNNNIGKTFNVAFYGVAGKSISFKYTVTNYSAMYATMYYHQVDASNTYTDKNLLSANGSYSGTIRNDTDRIQFTIWIGGLSDRRQSQLVISELMIDGVSILT